MHEKISEKELISFKTLRRDKCTSVKDSKMCETFSKISKMLSQKGQLEREVTARQKKENLSHTRNETRLKHTQSRRKSLNININSDYK